MFLSRQPSCWRLLAVGLALSATLGSRPVGAQRAIELQAGNWSVSGSNPTLYSAGIWRHLWGPLGYTLRGFAVLAEPSDSALYGLGPEITILRGGERRLSPFAVGGVGLAMRGGDANEIVALWNAGLGLEWNPLTWFGLAAEASYYLDDGSFRGFWNLREEDRRGWVFGARASVRWGRRQGDRAPAGEPVVPPPRATPPGIQSQSPGDSLRFEPVMNPPPAGPGVEAGSALAARVVETALAAMGEPYRWGGTSTDEGFDCSGLVWYAYKAHGMEIPRTSREQAGTGRAIAADIAVLEPGDILLFSNRPGVVTHVGLYVGEASFIHATTSGGVRVGRLDGSGDGNDRWYLDRWVGARRVLR